MRPGEELRVEGSRFERLTVVRELARPAEAGPISPASFVAHAYGPDGAELVVVERYRNLTQPSREALFADVKRTAALRFPNLGQVQDTSLLGGDVFVSTAFVEGELLGALRAAAAAAGRPVSIDVGVRVVVDVLAALSAIHTDKSAAGQPSLVHGAVAPHTIAVGFDGITRVLRPYMGRLVSLNLDAATAPYAAPEQLRNGKGSPRADIFSIGVVLWETLSQTRLFEKAPRDSRLARATMPIAKLVLEGDRAWAAPLGPIVEKALSADPLARYGTAAEMAAAVRLAVRAKLAMPARVAEVVDRHAGDRILARRGELALPSPSSGDRRSVRPSVPDGTARALANIRPSSRPPTPTPGAVAAVVVPKAPPLPAGMTKPRPIHTGPRPAMGAVELTPAPPSVDEVDFVDDVESMRLPGMAAPLPPPILPANLADDVLAQSAAPTADSLTASSQPMAAPASVAPPVSPVPAPPPQPTSAPRLLTPDPIAVPAEDVPAGLAPPGRRKWLPALLLLIPLLGLVAFFALHHFGDGPDPQGSASSTKLVPPPPTTTIATMATHSPSVTAATTSLPTATADPTADPSASTAASASAAPTGTFTGSPRPSNSTVRPKPTYDPEGI
ncbi:hypothetical protein BH09MYX1_BH09MYX1_45890 [soil metagenome]